MARGQHAIIFPTGDTSSAGKRILITATTNGTAQELHETPSEVVGAVYRYVDFLTVTAHNLDTLQHTLYLLWGGTTEPDDLIRIDLPPGLPVIVVIDADPLAGGLILKAYADTTSVISAGVRVDRLQQA